LYSKIQEIINFHASHFLIVLFQFLHGMGLLQLGDALNYEDATITSCLWNRVSFV